MMSNRVVRIPRGVRQRRVWEMLVSEEGFTPQNRVEREVLYRIGVRLGRQRREAKTEWVLVLDGGVYRIEERGNRSEESIQTGDR